MIDAPAATAASILDAAQRMTQAVGYNGLSFRDIAAAVGIKSASVHYHFPSKGQLGAAVARRYTDGLVKMMQEADAKVQNADQAFAVYIAACRASLQQDGRMCLCGMLAAEIDAVPEEVRVEVRRFVELNVSWVAGWIERANGEAAASDAVRDRARAIFAAVEGAMLIARGSGDISSFDAMTAQYLRQGLIPRQGGCR